MVNKPSKKPELVCPFCKEKGDAACLPTGIRFYCLCLICSFRTPYSTSRETAKEMWKSIRIKKKIKMVHRKAGSAGWSVGTVYLSHYFAEGKYKSVCGLVKNNKERFKNAQTKVCGMCIDCMIARGI